MHKEETNIRGGFSAKALKARNTSLKKGMGFEAPHILYRECREYCSSAKVGHWAQNLRRQSIYSFETQVGRPTDVENIKYCHKRWFGGITTFFRSNTAFLLNMVITQRR